MQASGESSPLAHVRQFFSAASPVSSRAGGDHTMLANNVNLTIFEGRAANKPVRLNPDASRVVTSSPSLKRGGQNQAPRIGTGCAAATVSFSGRCNPHLRLLVRCTTLPLLPLTRSGLQAPDSRCQWHRDRRGE